MSPQVIGAVGGAGLDAEDGDALRGEARRETLHGRGERGLRGAVGVVLPASAVSRDGGEGAEEGAGSRREERRGGLEERHRRPHVHVDHRRGRPRGRARPHPGRASRRTRRRRRRGRRGAPARRAGRGRPSRRRRARRSRARPSGRRSGGERSAAVRSASSASRAARTRPWPRLASPSARARARAEPAPATRTFPFTAPPTRARRRAWRRREAAARVETASRGAELGEARVHRRERRGVGEGVLGEVEAAAVREDDLVEPPRERAETLADVRDVEAERDAGLREREEAAPLGPRRLQDGEERGGALARDLLEEAAAPLGGRLPREERLVLDEAAPAVEAVPGAEGVEREEEGGGRPRGSSRRAPRRSRAR